MHAAAAPTRRRRTATTATATAIWCPTTATSATSTAAPPCRPAITATPTATLCRTASAKAQSDACSRCQTCAGLAVPHDRTRTRETGHQLLRPRCPLRHGAGENDLDNESAKLTLDSS